MCWALSLLATHDTSVLIETATGGRAIAYGVAALALGAIGLEAVAAVRWTPGRLNPMVAYTTLGSTIAVCGWAAWTLTETLPGALVGAAPAGAFAPLLLLAHTAQNHQERLGLLPTTTMP
ncbi:hypothetical protein O4J56_04805 [Nocardiopsis sp. RSe5-2]|uniref:Uncharacterized protein n=1 Tax=Nocardiopsis endophytica TaxID=3018445 RepID=A0ABT4TZ21_9ACTN|nr:hypothetical protein [Nocardiopsis endophytica]MDA2809948.1 hypothetical protein [Nocardiopsis endophytica]